MNEAYYFSSQPELEITAAQLGVGKWQWISLDEVNAARAQLIMSHNRIDVVPVVQRGSVVGYFQSDCWGDYDAPPSFFDIQNAPTAYYRMSLFDLLVRMENEGQLFYFLSNSSEVIGLMTIGNLNYKSVHAQIFQVVVGLEKSASEIVKKYFSEEEIIELLENSNDSVTRKPLEEHFKLRSKNMDCSIFEMLYLSSYCHLLKHLEIKLGNKECEILKFRKQFASNGSFNKVRNAAAHPSRAILNLKNPFDGIREINETVRAYRELRNVASQS